MLTAPKDQADYIETVLQIDERINRAKQASHDAMHSYRTLKMVRDGAAQKFEEGERRPTLRECMMQVAETQRQVQLGNLPYGGDDVVAGPSVLDKTAAAMRGGNQRAGGGGAYKRAIGVDGRVVRPSNMKQPAKVRQYVPPMKGPSGQ